MNVSLTKTLEQFVAEQVKTGRYQSASEVVREGLRLLVAREQSERLKLAGLREMIREGLESGPATPLDMDEVLSVARAERARRSQ
jgi:antitoxin ParD1/3/4